MVLYNISNVMVLFGQAYADAIVKKLFHNGHLIEIDSNTAKE
jgi:hypothetical protein